MANDKQSLPVNAGNNKGSGSDNLDEQTNKDIQSKGGRASHEAGQTQEEYQGFGVSNQDQYSESEESGSMDQDSAMGESAGRGQSSGRDINEDE